MATILKIFNINRPARYKINEIKYVYKNAFRIYVIYYHKTMTSTMKTKTENPYRCSYM